MLYVHSHSRHSDHYHSVSFQRASLSSSSPALVYPPLPHSSLLTVGQSYSSQAAPFSSASWASLPSSSRGLVAPCPRTLLSSSLLTVRRTRHRGGSFLFRLSLGTPSLGLTFLPPLSLSSMLPTVGHRPVALSAADQTGPLVPLGTA
jgi:hypothetical protein